MDAIAGTADEAEAAFGEYLSRTERDTVGVSSPQTTTRTAYAATALVAWHEWSYGHGGRTPTVRPDDE